MSVPRGDRVDARATAPASERSAIGARIAARRRRRARIGIAAGLVMVLVVAGTAAAFVAGGPIVPDFGYDSAAKLGQAPVKTPEEVQAELDRIVDEGMFNISIASTIDFASPDAPGTAYIENVPGNRYDMTVSVAMDGTGQTVYESAGIAPGSFIESIELSSAVSPGTWPATATFSAYDRETHELVGQAAAKVTLVVGEG